jgi:hypothetical protein
MFRLIKLAFYGLIGYTLYELYQGFSANQGGNGGGGSWGGGGSRDLNNALGSSAGRMQTLTGGGTGQNVSTLDDTGASATHAVGRGVTST